MDEKQNPWVTRASKTIYDNPWIKIIENDVLNPAGNPTIYGVVHFKNLAVAIIPIDEDGYTYLVGQYRYTMNSYEWEVPEGGSPEGESGLETAKRELLEETGIVAEDYQLILELQLSNSVTNECSETYLARGLSFSNPNPDEDEDLQLRKVHFADLVKMVLSGEIKDALSVASVLAAKEILGY